jgi:hypothetical protein
MVTAIQSRSQAACLGEEGSVDKRAGEESVVSLGVVTGNDEVVHGVAQSRDKEAPCISGLAKFESPTSIIRSVFSICIVFQSIPHNISS